jgi:hypothetical protein
MPSELLGSLPQLTAIVEKLGVAGILIVAVVWLVYERIRLMKLSARTFRQRDQSRLVAERYRSALLASDLSIPDVSDIIAEFAGEAD